ncbi:hypothetical protein AWC26_22300 [Mycobacterium shimoidei]|nr:hypothetical protein [Mycobacterium shimoidei]MCV7258015.1 hypothetical protein [Mycobacterium shimoidei]ORW76012.1 hypothetical protein AWC26_22300 [Mycobacterium shimoidei]
MTALRAARHHWRTRRSDQPNSPEHQGNLHHIHDFSSSASELRDWCIEGAGHRDDGERLLVHTAARQARLQRYLARQEARDQCRAGP